MQDAAHVLAFGDRWLALRDRLLANPRFQGAAAALWFTRPVARRRARALFDLCSGFVYSQVLFCCVRLGVFEKLASGPCPRAELARRCALPLESADTLFDAAIVLRLLEARSNERIGLGVLGAAMNGNPGVAAMVEHHALFYGDLNDPLALLRNADAARVARDGTPASPGTQLARYWAYVDQAQPAALGAAQIEAYTALMSASQPLVAGQILRAYNLKRHHCLLDVGGGDGTFIQQAAAHARHLNFMLFDLPAVAERARQRFQSAGLAGRAHAHGGDFLQDDLPYGADIASLVRVIHDHNDGGALRILRAVRRALPVGGVLLLAEPMAAMRGAETVGDAYFGFYLLAMGRGRPRTAQRLMELVREAGFGDIRRIATDMPLQTALLTARAVRKPD